MEDGVVLDVRVVADDNAVDVAANDSVVPDAGMLPDGHISQNNRAASDIHPIAQSRFFAEKRLELLIQFVHGLVLAKWECGAN
jgi:hypothetical protein